MNDRAERVDAVAVEQNVDLDEVGALLAALLVVQRGVAARAGLELIEEVENDLGQGQLVVQLHAVLAQVVHALHRAAAFLTQLHDGARELGGRQDRRVDHGLAHLGNLSFGELARVVDAHLGAVLRHNAVDDVRSGRDEIEVKLALQTLADDLQVEQSEEAAAEAEAEGRGGLGLEGQRGVVELEALESVAQVREVGAIDRVDAREDHRVRVAVALESLGRAAHLAGDGIADTGLPHVLHARDQVADLASTDALFRLRLGRDDAQLQELVGGARRHHAHALTGRQNAVDDTHVGDDAAVRVVHGVENHRARRGVGGSLGGGDDLDDAVEEVLDALAGLAGDLQDLTLVAADQLSDLVRILLGLGARQVDLVEDRDDREVILEGQVQVRERLGLNALRSVDEEDRTLARSQGAGDLVRKVHVTGRVNHVERVGGTLVCPRHAHRLALDRDSALALDIHTIEVLVAHLARLDDAGQLEHAVRERRLPMIDMGDDAEVTDLPLRGMGRANLRLLLGRGDGHVNLREVVNLLIVPLSQLFVPVQAREVAHSGHASHHFLPYLFPSSALSTLRLSEESRSLAKIALLPVIGVVISELAGDRHRLPLISAQRRESQQDRADAGGHWISIPQVPAAVLGQNRPEVLARIPIPAHPGVARDLVAQPQDAPVTVVRDGQQSVHVALVEGDGLVVATIS